jgi:hypothetical protein
MGYDITIQTIPSVKPKHIETVRELIKKDDPISCDWIISDSGYWDDCWESFRANTDAIALLLAPYMAAGEMEFLGEDNEKWGFEFDGKGKVFYINYVHRRGSELLYEFNMKGKRIRKEVD